MYLHPYMASQVAKERQREMLAHAEKRRLVTLAVAARAGQCSQKKTRPVRESVWRVLRLGFASQR